MRSHLNKTFIFKAAALPLPPSTGTLPNFFFKAVGQDFNNLNKRGRQEARSPRVDNLQLPYLFSFLVCVAFEDPKGKLLTAIHTY